MRKSIFIDTSFIIALEDADAPEHEKALNCWEKIKPCKIITTSYIFDETVTFIKRRLGYKKAVETGKRLRESSSVDIIHISEEDVEKGWEMFLKYDDKGYSLTDCISFVIMQKMKMIEALTLDTHFKQMGFKVLPC